MQEHYGFNDQQFAALLAQGITIADLYHAVKEFKADNAPVSMVSLMNYADAHGDFTETLNPSKTDIIANAVFNRMSMKEKIAIGEYLTAIEDGDF